MANVSRGTVDRVLNNRGGVNPKTAERVRLIAERLHYSPCATGRGLAMMKKGMKLGFVRTSPLGSDSVPDRILDRKIQELSEYGIAVLSRSYPEGDIPLLLRVLDELAAQSVLGIAVSPVPCREAEEKINDLAGRGIAVVTYNHDLPDTRRLAFVGCDYYRNGRILAGLIRLIVDGRGKIGIVSGTLSAAAHAQRIYGLENRLAEDCPNVHVVSHAVCALDDVSTYAAVKKLLAENPGLDLLVLNTVSACGAIRAIREWPERVRVICVSCAPEMEPYLEDHTVDAMIMHQPWVQTDMSIDILFQYLVWGKKPASPAFFIDDEIILAENMRSQRMVP